MYDLRIHNERPCSRESPLLMAWSRVQTFLIRGRRSIHITLACAYVAGPRDHPNRLLGSAGSSGLRGPEISLNEPGEISKTERPRNVKLPEKNAPWVFEPARNVCCYLPEHRHSP